MMTQLNRSRRGVFPAFFWIFATCACGPLGAAPTQMTQPDFTLGDQIPAGAPHDWNLGSTGARGWMYTDNLVTTDARQIKITNVDKGSPADGMLFLGDVLVGVNGRPFSYDPRTELSKAITVAETEERGGRLALLRWREGRTEEIILVVPELGSYSATVPYNCPKSQRIFEQGCQGLAVKMATPEYNRNAITRSLNALALLASGDPKYLPLVKREAQWAVECVSEDQRT